jgi:hypothetical protein
MARKIKYFMTNAYSITTPDGKYFDAFMALKLGELNFSTQ